MLSFRHTKQTSKSVADTTFNKNKTKSKMENLTHSFRGVLHFISIKFFEKVVNNRIFDHPEKCGLFYDFQYGFRSSESTTDLLAVVSDRIARAFNRSGGTRAVALDISKVLERVWYAGFLLKLS